MGVKYTTKHDGLKSMKKELDVLGGKSVEVGVLKGEHQWLAGIHEYGCNITVTPRMRAYLHRRGLHLKKSTTHIRIPERSFLRTGYDTNRADVLKKAQLMMADVATGRMSANDCLDGVGQELSDKIKDYAVELDSPANHSFTVGNKGSSNPLVQTGDMIGGITWRVK